MILNEATDILYGTIGQEAVYSGEEFVWPMSADYLYYVTSQEVGLYFYTGEETELKVPKSINRNKVTTIANSCCNNRDIVSVKIANGIKEIE